jgi:HAD superfamily hydrolase (TIGR01549 family)
VFSKIDRQKAGSRRMERKRGTTGWMRALARLRPLATDGARFQPGPSEGAVKAVLFDVDGTLYHQPLMRAFMAAELATLPATQGSMQRAREVWRILRIFRHVREELRAPEPLDEPLERLQYTAASRTCGHAPEVIAGVVDEWMYRRPVKYLRLCRRAGLRACVEGLRREGLRVGALSDYPVQEKLAALGVLPHFSVALCTTEPEINAFKPHPAGFLRASEQWGLRPAEVLYVGDRADVDAAGAAAAGMPCVIVCRRPPGPTYETVSSFTRLHRAFNSHR